MKITWITRSFLHYRIPIYSEINKLSKNNLTVIFNSEITPLECQQMLKSILGSRAIGLEGEIIFGGKKIENQSFANKGGVRVTLLPGLVSTLKKTNPDIIFSDGFFQWTYAALLNNLIWKTPHLMFYERTLHTEREVSMLRHISRKIASNFISGISCNGIETKKYLMRFGYPVEKLFLGNMAADNTGLQNKISKISAFEISKLKQRYNLKEDVFLYVGQLIPRKGIIQLLQNWKDFEKQFPSVTLVLLGDGNQFDYVKNYLKVNMIENVCLAGKVNYSEVSKFYATANIFIIPPLEDNWSLVVPEAMSAGLPIICSKYNGCWPELVQSENGWVFDPLNKNNFKETLEKALKNKENWKKMGEVSRNIVENFSPEKIATKIYDSCKKITRSN